MAPKRKPFESLGKAQRYQRARTTEEEEEAAELAEPTPQELGYASVPSSSSSLTPISSPAVLSLPSSPDEKSLDIVSGVAPLIAHGLDPSSSMHSEIEAQESEAEILDSLVDNDFNQEELMALEDEKSPLYCDSDDDLPYSDEEFSDEAESSDEGFAEKSDGATKEGTVVDSVKKFLGLWAQEEGTTHKALGSLCKGLKSRVPDLADLPVTATTIMGTPRAKCQFRTVAPGKYYHISLKTQLQTLLSLLTFSISCVDLLFNIDGLPLFKSSSSEVWPILFSCPNISNLRHKAFPVGIYFGTGKPESISDFLSEFVDELLDILENGFVYKGAKVVIKILGFCCDVPARAFLLSTVSHTGYYSCGRCVVKGETVENRRVFTNLNCAPRTDVDIRQKKDKKFQPPKKVVTPLFTIVSLNFVSSFILDPMHLIDLGAMRKLMVILCCGGVPFQLSVQLKSLLSANLIALRSHIPCEFNRLPRELKELPRFKATEYRALLLYYGPVVFKDVLQKDQYEHFLALHVAISILSNASLCKLEANQSYAKGLLRYFVSRMPVVYAKRYVTHNIHNLIHVVEDCSYFGKLIENFSLYKIAAYPFENFLSSIKRMVRAKSKPLEQICKRFMEAVYSSRFHKKYFGVNETEIKFEDQHTNGPLPSSCTSPQFNKAVFPDFTVTTGSKNNCCTSNNGDIFLVENIAFSQVKKAYVLIGRKYIGKTSFYKLGKLPSSEVGIYKVEKNKLEKVKRMWLPSQVKHKNVRLPYKDDFFVTFPLLHTC